MKEISLHKRIQFWSEPLMALQAKWHGHWPRRRRVAPAAFGFGFRTDAGFGLCFSALCSHFAMSFSPRFPFFFVCPSNNVKHLFAHIFNCVQHVIFFINTQAHIYLYLSLSLSLSLSLYVFVCFLFAFALCITGAVFAQCRRITNCFKYPASKLASLHKVL